MHEIKTARQSGSRILKFALVCLVVYFAFVLISQRVAVGEKQQQLADLQQEIYVQELSNNELRHDINENTGNNEHIEDVARSEYNYAMPGERVFVNVAGE